jgi:hypothetical protein
MPSVWITLSSWLLDAAECLGSLAVFIKKPLEEEKPMKSLVSMIVALGLAVAFTGAAFAATKMPTTQAACEKAHMTWDATTKKCSKGAM